MDCKLPKSERLHSKKLIKELFDKGSSFFLYPFKVIYYPLEDNTETNQVLFSVSKKKIKHAVDRNYIKRRMKEAYRLNKYLLLEDQSKKKLIAFVYVSPKKESYQAIAPKIKKILIRLAKLPKNRDSRS